MSQPLTEAAIEKILVNAGMACGPTAIKPTGLLMTRCPTEGDIAKAELTSPEAAEALRIGRRRWIEAFKD